MVIIMVKKIIMELPNYNVFIDNNECKINDKLITITQKDMENIIRCIRNWKKEYINSNIIDGTKYFIIINNSDEYSFLNDTPDDFNCLIEVLGDLYGNY